ncbi:hypothetical protein M407DRAFT_21805 [Tulasnella calospora MUT 4182]|uniref:Uncharacterized protein n=1 Tax=Tulasnella calospora MUT 4182 TaxID=1051891 RepID=A0A0C3M5Y1_9AGAM|nr:hypothetical protein M407DRAFT_21805 [Tulasnella calospora MUT 4182]
MEMEVTHRLHRVQLDNPPAFCEHEYTGISEEDTYERDASSTAQSQPFLGVDGFMTSGLWVKDFITLNMIPPDPEHSPL